MQNKHDASPPVLELNGLPLFHCPGQPRTRGSSQFLLGPPLWAARISRQRLILDCRGTALPSGRQGGVDTRSSGPRGGGGAAPEGDARQVAGPRGLEVRHRPQGAQPTDVVGPMPQPRRRAGVEGTDCLVPRELHDTHDTHDTRGRHEWGNRRGGFLSHSV